MREAVRTPTYGGAGDRRRSIIALAGTLIAVFVVNSLIGLFAIRYAGDAEGRDREVLARLAHAADTAREAQVAFKIQVQEWKNMLLRGSDPGDAAHHLAGFEAQERRVAEQLGQLAAVAADLGLDAAEVRAAAAEHEALGRRYRAALEGSDRSDPAAVAAVDRAVRGIDRPFDRTIDALAEAARARADAVRATTESARMERYDTLRTVAVASMLVGVALVGIILVRATWRRD
ncbi:hypothetical protein [Azospirillum halopraeferens]|uniref:hypothetical protein n=1 Tax=Azospirillum halopraeferens TaxID=34010 RepID=UPI0012ECAFA5|nr:hypothetical protein [Azospirillum halopraeferens]